MFKSKENAWANLSDFGVLTSRIADPLYSREDLIALRLSGDIHVNLAAQFEEFPVTDEIVSTIVEVVDKAEQIVSAGPVTFRHIRDIQEEFIYTVPTGLIDPQTYRVTIEAYDSMSGSLLDKRVQEFAVKLGGDHYFEPPPEPITRVTMDGTVRASARFSSSIAQGLQGLKPLGSSQDSDVAPFPNTVTVTTADLVAIAKGEGTENGFNYLFEFENARNLRLPLTEEQRAEFPGVPGLTVWESASAESDCSVFSEYFSREQGNVTVSLTVFLPALVSGTMFVAISQGLRTETANVEFRGLATDTREFSATMAIEPGRFEVRSAFTPRTQVVSNLLQSSSGDGGVLAEVVVSFASDE